MAGTKQENTSQICPCMDVKAIHIGGCLFSATLIGAAFAGYAGAAVGAAFGLVVGLAAVSSMKSQQR
jgi:hypothetical protein